MSTLVISGGCSGCSSSMVGARLPQPLCSCCQPRFDAASISTKSLLDGSSDNLSLSPSSAMISALMKFLALSKQMSETIMSVLSALNQFILSRVFFVLVVFFSPPNGDVLKFAWNTRTQFHWMSAKIKERKMCFNYTKQNDYVSSFKAANVSGENLILIFTTDFPSNLRVYNTFSLSKHTNVAVSLITWWFPVVFCRSSAAKISPYRAAFVCMVLAPFDVTLWEKQLRVSLELATKAVGCARNLNADEDICLRFYLYSSSTAHTVHPSYK